MNILGISRIVIDNLLGYDALIFVWAGITLILFVKAKQNCTKLKHSLMGITITRRENAFRPECLEPVEKANEAQIIAMHSKQEKFYTAFINMTSVFPLLGMIGTVFALLNLSIDGSEEMLTSNFFVALTSTFWGAVFGVIAKAADCFLAPNIDENNERYHLCIERNNLGFDTENAGEENEAEQNIT